MNTRTGLYIAICFLISIVAVILLYFVSMYANKKENGFVRIFPPHLVGFNSKIDLKYNSYYVAGLTDNYIYLGNSTASTQIISSNYALTDTHHIALRVPQNDSVAWGAIIAHIDSPRIVLTEGIVPSMFAGGFDTLESVKGIISSGHFSKVVPLSKSTFILRIYDTPLKQNVLVKYSSLSNQGLVKKYILEKQVDGIFCTDGMLSYNDSGHYLMYVYYYRNQFVKLDSNLNIIYKGRTIDTTSTAQIKVYTDKATMQSRMAAPPVYVNKRTAISNKWLFINSGLLASNEDNTAFKESAVIDVYSVLDGKYHFSFYLPIHKGIRLTSFTISDKYIVCVYERYLLCFKLNF